MLRGHVNLSSDTAEILTCVSKRIKSKAKKSHVIEIFYLIALYLYFFKPGESLQMPSQERETLCVEHLRTYCHYQWAKQRFQLAVLRIYVR